MSDENYGPSPLRKAYRYFAAAELIRENQLTFYRTSAWNPFSERRQTMTEQEFLTSTDPVAMLRHVEGKVSDRKLRLFACACCRQVWDGTRCQHCGGVGTVITSAGPGYDRTEKCPTCNGTGKVGGLTDPRSRAAVETAELFVDGMATEEKRAAARILAYTVCQNELPSIKIAAAECCNASALTTAQRAIINCQVGRAVLPTTQANLMREIIGNPFRPVTVRMGLHCSCCGKRGFRRHGVHFDHQFRCGDCNLSWEPGVDYQHWITPTVINLAQSIYDTRDFTIMPILADTLEEAGCQDAAILDHCRGPGPHALGCWVLDLILGKS